MKNFILPLLALLSMLTCAAQEPLVGMTDTAAYFPLLRGRRVAVLANHTSVASMPGCGAESDAAGRVHLVDLLHQRGFDVVAIFSPEHGFRGTADAGERVRSSVDERTGIPIRSLYDGRTLRPSDEAMRSFDVLLVDMQDVGVRFYTYYISMIRMMDACADFGRAVVVLDRPNPNDHTVDGPVLDMKYKSGVGWLPLPVLHGMTLGEIARMAVGEGWTRRCDLTVIPCRGYVRTQEYALPVPPSPNLPTGQAVALYPSLCLFEGTVMSVGRGTDRPFECFGHPDLPASGYGFLFTPRSMAGAKHPPYEEVVCRGLDLRGCDRQRVRERGLDLMWLCDAYRASEMGDAFFTPMFEKLIGVGWVRGMIEAGASPEEIRARWEPDVARFRQQRRPYLLYAEP